jgi:molecular chaperone GrpE
VTDEETTPPEAGHGDASTEPRPPTNPDTPGREAEEVAGGDSVAGGESAAGGDSVAGDGSAQVVGELNELVEGLRMERDEYLDLARRAKADFENYRKRASQQTAEASKRGKAELARELLPAIDNLERALSGADTESDSFARGVGLVRDQLLETLVRAGVESYDPTGERFDPSWHEAVSTRPADDGGESGVVLETLDRGFRMDGQVLRPAHVVVSE